MIRGVAVAEHVLAMSPEFLWFHFRKQSARVLAERDGGVKGYKMFGQ